MNLTYETMKALEGRLNEKLPYTVNIFNDRQYRMSRIRDRLRVSLNRISYYGENHDIH